ncbi:oxygen-insensitive NADPH nitroreductase [Alkalicoccus chagannorensis]|uniref:oxygen-insensitive NADPH nitroreductase n=1 Tax=Alkalicoccus chagannorensis TaxID=427072 RepID=UPI0003FF62DE|nr:oxygen-insensitive NADPH nitroreductase [Alkalicoccus chagannorensis]
MNETIKTMLEHRSIRSFSSEPLNEETITTLVEAAQAASTSSYVQAYSIIGVTDDAMKQELAALAGNQPYVAENGHFFVFCADFHRHKIAGEIEDVSVDDAVRSTEKFIVGLTDATLAAQNCALAAESMGLGICYIGGIRNNIQAVSDVLGLPDHVMPVFGLCVGYPENHSDKKPRLPKGGIYFENGYPEDDAHRASLKEYNAVVSAYYEQRTGGSRADTWTSQITGMLSSVKREHMKSYLEERGFINL